MGEPDNTSSLAALADSLRTGPEIIQELDQTRRHIAERIRSETERVDLVDFTSGAIAAFEEEPQEKVQALEAELEKLKQEHSQELEKLQNLWEQQRTRLLDKCQNLLQENEELKPDATSWRDQATLEAKRHKAAADAARLDAGDSIKDAEDQQRPQKVQRILAALPDDKKKLINDCRAIFRELLNGQDPAKARILKTDAFDAYQKAVIENKQEFPNQGKFFGAFDVKSAGDNKTWQEIGWDTRFAWKAIRPEGKHNASMICMQPIDFRVWFSEEETTIGRA